LFVGGADGIGETLVHRRQLDRLDPFGGGEEVFAFAYLAKGLIEQVVTDHVGMVAVLGCHVGPGGGLGGADVRVLVQVLPCSLNSGLKVVGEEAAGVLKRQAVVLGGPRRDAVPTKCGAKGVLMEAHDHPDAPLLS